MFQPKINTFSINVNIQNAKRKRSNYSKSIMKTLEKRINQIENLINEKRFTHIWSMDVKMNGKPHNFQHFYFTISEKQK